MRGLGIGIILTTLIITISGGTGKLSDQEIIERAGKLGMVTQDEKEDKLSDVIKGVKPTESIPTPTKAPIKPVSPTVTPAITPEITKKPTITPKPKKKTKNTKRKQEQNQKSVTFTIKEGMSSGTVSKILYKKGLIDDAKKFNSYIVKKKKQNVVKIGTYIIPGKPSYETILDMITY